MRALVVGVLSVFSLSALAAVDTQPAQEAAAVAPGIDRAARVVRVVDPIAHTLPVDQLGVIRCEATVSVDPSGTPVDARVTGCDPLVRGQVGRALLRWSWEPEIRDGHALSSEHVFDVTIHVHPKQAGAAPLVVTRWVPVSVTTDDRAVAANSGPRERPRANAGLPERPSANTGR